MHKQCSRIAQSTSVKYTDYINDKRIDTASLCRQVQLKRLIRPLNFDLYAHSNRLHCILGLAVAIPDAQWQNFTKCDVV